MEKQLIWKLRLSEMSHKNLLLRCTIACWINLSLNYTSGESEWVVSQLAAGNMGTVNMGTVIKFWTLTSQWSLDLVHCAAAERPLTSATVDPLFLGLTGGYNYFLSLRHNQRLQQESRIEIMHFRSSDDDYWWKIHAISRWFPVIVQCVSTLNPW